VNRLPVIVSIACLVAAVVIAGFAWTITHERPKGAVSEAGVSGAVRSVGTPAIGGPFHLVDQTGRAVDEGVLKGKWSVVFFGYTFCPDVCPTTLQTLATTKQLMGREGDRLQVVFITVDPERDTPAALKAYLDSVGLPGALGLSGSRAQVDAAVKAYRAYYQRRPTDDGSYVMDHSTMSYLMKPDGTFAAPLPYGQSPQQTAALIRDAMQQRS
jgi:protein SCO1/2